MKGRDKKRLMEIVLALEQKRDFGVSYPLLVEAFQGSGKRERPAASLRRVESVEVTYSNGGDWYFFGNVAGQVRVLVSGVHFSRESYEKMQTFKGCYGVGTCTRSIEVPAIVFPARNFTKVRLSLLEG